MTAVETGELIVYLLRIQPFRPPLRPVVFTPALLHASSDLIVKSRANDSAETQQWLTCCLLHSQNQSPAEGEAGLGMPAFTGSSAGCLVQQRSRCPRGSTSRGCTINDSDPES